MFILSDLKKMSTWTPTAKWKKYGKYGTKTDIAKTMIRFLGKGATPFANLIVRPGGKKNYNSVVDKMRQVLFDAVVDMITNGVPDTAAAGAPPYVLSATAFKKFIFSTGGAAIKQIVRAALQRAWQRLRDKFTSTNAADDLDALTRAGKLMSIEDRKSDGQQQLTIAPPPPKTENQIYDRVVGYEAQHALLVANTAYIPRKRRPESIGTLRLVPANTNNPASRHVVMYVDSADKSTNPDIYIGVAGSSSLKGIIADAQLWADTARVRDTSYFKMIEAYLRPILGAQDKTSKVIYGAHSLGAAIVVSLRRTTGFIVQQSIAYGFNSYMSASFRVVPKREIIYATSGDALSNYFGGVDNNKPNIRIVDGDVIQKEKKKKDQSYLPSPLGVHGIKELILQTASVSVGFKRLADPVLSIKVSLLRGAEQAIVRKTNEEMKRPRLKIKKRLRPQVDNDYGGTISRGVERLLMPPVLTDVADQLKSQAGQVSGMVESMAPDDTAALRGSDADAAEPEPEPAQLPSPEPEDEDEESDPAPEPAPAPEPEPAPSPAPEDDPEPEPSPAPEDDPSPDPDDPGSDLYNGDDDDVDDDNIVPPPTQTGDDIVAGPTALQSAQRRAWDGLKVKGNQGTVRSALHDNVLPSLQATVNTLFHGYGKSFHAYRIDNRYGVAATAKILKEYFGKADAIATRAQVDELNRAILRNYASLWTDVDVEAVLSAEPFSLARMLSLLVCRYREVRTAAEDLHGLVLRVGGATSTATTSTTSTPTSGASATYATTPDTEAGSTETRVHASERKAMSLIGIGGSGGTAFQPEEDIPPPTKDDDIHDDDVSFAAGGLLENQALYNRKYSVPKPLEFPAQQYNFG